ncbi:MAG: hypothetical protein Q8N14_07140 [Candidatus Omnitrophota bacterium]|nr:hypothetical protein [Candidatus Omnitrophota bacterium]
MGREKPSIKSDIKDFFIIVNCVYITITCLASLLLSNKILVAAAFTFTLLNALICYSFFSLRITRYQRPEEPNEPQ